jgi:hypothetical protein
MREIKETSSNSFLVNNSVDYLKLDARKKRPGSHAASSSSLGTYVEDLRCEVGEEGRPVHVPQVPRDHMPNLHVRASIG